MNKIFADLIVENKVCVYIDDILIYLGDLAEHCWITDMVLQRLRKHKLYLKLDKCEFEQQCIEYLRLINSLVIFQTMINEIFADLIVENKICIYIDDILIYLADLAEHHQITDMVFQRLRKHKLYLKLDKCEFKQQHIEYLGLIISEGKIEMGPVKVARVVEWPTLQSKKKVQQFVGFTNFYQWFIKDIQQFVGFTNFYQ